MWSAALGAGNPNDAVQKVHGVPPQVEEAGRAAQKVDQTPLGKQTT